MSESIFFTSDEHYGHANVLKFCNRPFADVNEMTEKLIENHNKVVSKGDLVYHLGDMFWRTLTVDQCVAIRLRLNGNHYYINGNHEERMQNSDMKRYFVYRKDYDRIHPKGYPRIVLMHYCLRTWEGSHRGDWHLYGHSHGGLPLAVQGLTKEESPLSMDVGVDTHEMFPYSLEEVAERMQKIKDSYQGVEVANTFPREV